MSRHPQLYHWQKTLTRRFPHLPKTFVALLALWTLGMILARRCGLSSVALFLARLLGRKENTLRQRLREFYQEKTAKAGAKQGRKRRDFAAADCFAPLLQWILSYWSCRRLVLALDPTTLGDRLHVLCVSVVYRGLAIPVAWKILPGQQPEAWHPHWCALLDAIEQGLGTGWEVLVLTDRGLESSRLFEAIVAHGWHPLMRVKQGSQFRPAGWHHFHGLSDFASHVGARYAAVGRAYKTSATPLDCTLLACWEAGHDEPWLLLTDLAQRASNPCWYAYRAWIEQGFKVIKSGGWQWQYTRMTDPGRLERHWLAIAVATLWVVAIGGQASEEIAVETIGSFATGPSARRAHRVFMQGLAILLAALVNGPHLPRWRFDPESRPEPWHRVPTLTETTLDST
jgi:Transposase DDE domain